MAKAYNQRPSTILGVENDEYTAYCVDEATWLWGSHVEAEVHEATRPQMSGTEAQKQKTEETRVQNSLEMAFKKLGITKDEATEQSPPSSGTAFVDRG